MSSYLADRAWSDQFIPAFKAIAGSLLLETAPYEVDASEATDLIVLAPIADASTIRIACRVRQHQYASKYSGQFTIRSKRANGSETELSKIMRGFGTWLIYGFQETPGSNAIQPWYCIDLNELRDFLARQDYPLLPSKSESFEECDNRDGTYFIAFNLLRLWGQLLYASSKSGKIRRP